MLKISKRFMHQVAERKPVGLAGHRPGSDRALRCVL
jgi:hypothetical protein